MPGTSARSRSRPLATPAGNTCARLDGAGGAGVHSRAMAWLLFAASGIVAAAVLARWVDPRGAGRRERAASAVVVTAMVAIAAGWGAVAVGLRRLPTQTTITWVSGGDRRVDHPSAEQLASLQSPDVAGDYPGACRVPTLSPAQRRERDALERAQGDGPGPHTPYTRSTRNELRCPIGRFEYESWDTQGGMFGGSEDGRVFRGYEWSCGSGSVVATRYPPSLSVERHVVLRISQDGSFAEFTCIEVACSIEGPIQCDPVALGGPLPPPLYLVRHHALRSEVQLILPVRMRGETARLALSSALLGLLSIAALRRIAAPTHVALLDRALPAAPYRAGVDERPPRAHRHARWLVAVTALYSIGSVASVLAFARS